jgi:hypothetical protein
VPMMRTTLGLIVAAMLLAAMLLTAAPARADFDIDLKADTKYAPGLKVDKPTRGRNFGEHVVSYVRILPPTQGARVFPAFISTQNYLTCPDSDKRIPLSDVKQVTYDRHSGVKVLGFWFDPPGCDSPTFHMEPVLAN